MLITVKKPKLVLGRTVYLRGDVFECRDAEAKLLVASGIVMKSAEGTKATKGSPTPPTTGVSMKPGTPPASKEVAAARTTSRGKTAPAAIKPAVKPAETIGRPTQVEAKPVGAMTMPEPSVPPVSTPVIAPAAIPPKA